ncbi:pyruvate formate-lyase-activating protein [Clostridium ganghwense]|uniref:Pyruvate formate-lyase-activating enzyme n=1 Tax=Clostridium ganghwense TaxID=312089 RepID=A0ABT4CNX2_9CLOT|nr:pyruvate formate-lyase-activating protein [Clostridium ganghwense]MCY6369674.1 pyruvate formate-lyase-activating protein [Clostridium ganghwense]
MIKGRIHSFESMGLVDGPGIRNVVFFQGCPLRCLFCHNPDTWNFDEGIEISSEELINKIIKFKPYFKNNGGVTFSGGEPLMQPKFLLEMLKLCKKHNIHTTIDTSGCGSGNYEEILKYTNLILLDIKHSTNDEFKTLTGVSMKNLIKFIEVINSSHTKVWIRHVIIPGITDSNKHLEKLKEIIKKIKNVEKIEFLPYHTLGIDKYKTLNYDFKLKNLEPMDKNKCKALEQTFITTLLS